MGSDKTTTNSSGQQQQTQTVTASPEQQELDKLSLANAKELNPQTLDVQKTFLNLAKQLGMGEPLPGYLSKLPGGISPDVTQSLVDRSIRDIQPTFQGRGLLDSGVNASISARTAGDIRNQSEQFNLQNLQQLLNIGVGGQAQIQQPILGYTGLLSDRLKGLGTTSSSGSYSGSQTTTTMNPFLKSFQQSAGSGLGNIFNPSTYFKPCWVAAEIFGGMFQDKTIQARNFFLFKAPISWLAFYMDKGESFAKFIRNKPMIKLLIRPLFEFFAMEGKAYGV